MAQQEVSRPIRLVVGIGNNWVQGFAVVYEQVKGSAGSVNVWFDSEKFSKVRFSDTEESRIVWIVTTEDVEVGNLFSGYRTESKESWEIKEIVIRRDFQK